MKMKRIIISILFISTLLGLTFYGIKSNQPNLVTAASNPPGIPDVGAYAVAEKRIIGPPVNLALIADGRDVSIIDDYVQYPYENGLVRVYFDNTIYLCQFI